MKHCTIVLLTLAVVITLIGLSPDASGVQAGSRVSQQPGRPAPPPGPEGRGPGGPDGMFLALLDLTDAQKAQIRRLREAEREAARPFHDQLRQIHDELRRATENGAFDEAAVRAILAREAQVMTELNLSRLKTEAAIWQTLTPEQRTKLAELREKLRKEHDDNRPPAR
ncbi:MAG TPA: Spy/CpxP family protein refolding chaperone [Blastocatellia bacterium]|nr:Spy/CpxP family protein refolding chaperone [Blastocatellia bacterium]